MYTYVCIIQGNAQLKDALDLKETQKARRKRTRVSTTTVRVIGRQEDLKCSREQSTSVEEMKAAYRAAHAATKDRRSSAVQKGSNQKTESRGAEEAEEEEKKSLINLSHATEPPSLRLLLYGK